jgi:hypothetical protein
MLVVLAGCGGAQRKKEAKKEEEPMTYQAGQFGYDLDLMKKYQNDLVILHDDSAQAQVLISPAYQGRVMTSTAGGEKGTSYGWINHELIASGEKKTHMNAYGGEERFWLGPEGGQYALYFKKGVPFTYDNWFVPAEIDTQPFALVRSSLTEAVFSRKMHLENYSGAVFDLQVDRTIRLLNQDFIQRLLSIEIPAEVKMVAFESDNTITNVGQSAWSRKTGLPSIWILSMLNAAPQGLVAVPYKPGSEKELGKVVTDTYFGKVPAERLKVKDSLMIFKTDAAHRSKIGISPKRALPWIASYDRGSHVLTLAQFTLPDKHPGYVNSVWEIQKDPYGGDAVNAYNDGPVEDGTQMGKFYEIESSSPAAELKPNETLKHVHRTIHFEGDEAQLKLIARKAVGLDLDKVTLE